MASGSPPASRPSELLAQLPAVHELLTHERIRAFDGRIPRPLVVLAIQEALEVERRRILEADAEVIPPTTDGITRAVESRLQSELVSGPREVINATGVVLHTNLGRAPLAERAIERISQVAREYSTLELDVESGKRGSRHVHVEGLLKQLTGAEAAFAVNNGAGAVLLALSTLASGRDVIVSRGELIEIGGSFRVPEIMEASGARLVEVGTTNRTHLRDYQDALTDDTAAFLKVHPSNYRVVGFQSEVSVRALSQIASEGTPLLVDLGSGNLVDLSELGGPHEPVVSEVLRNGADVVTFSGDKLLGGPQAGIIAGRAHLVNRMRRNPLARALRADKLTLAGLAATLRLYLDPSTRHDIPTFRMITEPSERVFERARQVLAAIERAAPGAHDTVEIRPTHAAVGGGSMPGEDLESAAVVLTGDANAIERGLRAQTPAVLARIRDDAVWLDARTLRDDQVDAVANAVVRVLATSDVGHKQEEE